MNPEVELIFAYLEEDNIPRAYFRARPILTMNGDIREEADEKWPNEGCLRIVPDKNEQHTFKERMRTLGAWCLLDLTGYAAEANKIRTNKNYRPEQGEINQYILYSDAVKALPDTLFYEVLDGAPADFSALAQRSITPRFFIREGDTLYGPAAKTAETAPEAAAACEGTLFELSLPDGAQHTMLVIPAENKITQRPPMPVRTRPIPNHPGPISFASPAATPAPVPVPAPATAPSSAKAEEEALPIGKTLNILDQNQTFEETLQGLDQPLSSQANLLHTHPAESVTAPFMQTPAAPLTGTPLFRAPLHTSTPQPKNKVQEVVASQVRIVRNDPPAEPLPSGCRLTQVENPVEAACQALKQAWQLTDSRAQLSSFIMSLDGMKTFVTPGCTASSSPLQQAIQQQLQDLEAERLSALVQLDKAKADVDLYRKNTLEGASAQAKGELDKLAALKDDLNSSIESLKEQLNLLIAQRETYAAQVDALKNREAPAAAAQLLADAGMAAAANIAQLRLSPVCGQRVPMEQLLARVQTAMTHSGLTYDRNRAIAFLTLLALCPRIGVVAQSPAATATLTENLVKQLGWGSGYGHQVTLDQKPLVTAAPTDGTPALLMTSLALFAPLNGIRKLMLGRTAAHLTRNAAYEADPWPIFPLNQLPFIPTLDEAIGAPVSLSSLDELLAHPAETAVVDTALKPMLACIAPLSGRAYKAMAAFTAACAGVMDGGLAAACDWALLLWVLPVLERTPANIAAVKPLLAEYPLSLAAL